MKYYVIADSDTVLGFRYIGVRGEEVTNAEQARAALSRAEADPAVGVVIITDTIAQAIRPEVNRVRFGTPRPLVVEIPGRGGAATGRQTLLEMIREAVGIRI